MVSALVFTSRVLHMISSALLLSACVVPLLYPQRGEPAHPWVRLLTPVCAGISALTGLFNAHSLQPARMGARAAPWRVAVYGVKFALLLACTPLLDKTLALTALGDAHSVAVVRLACILNMFFIATWSRFYREQHSQPPPPTTSPKVE